MDDPPTGVLELPNEILSEVVGKLDDKGRRNLTQVNYRFHSLVEYHRFRSNRHSLIYAAYHGHMDRARMLIKFGAANSTYKRDYPVAAAVARGHEEMALMLLGRLGIRPTSMGSKTLQTAVLKKLVKVVSSILRRSSEWQVEWAEQRDAALYNLLKGDFSRSNIIGRKLHEDSYQIVQMLLQHGANPDNGPSTVPNLIVEGGRERFPTARHLSTRHPDPRVRNTLQKTMRSHEPKSSNLKVGRSWIADSEAEGQEYHEYSGETRSARLWDYLTDPTESGTEYPLDDDSEEDDRSVEVRSVSVSISTSTEPPPISSYPQLGTLGTNVQHEARDLWASASPHIRSSVVSRTQAAAASSQTVKRREKVAQTEEFPQLGRPVRVAPDTAKESWTNFTQKSVGTSTIASQREAAKSPYKGKPGQDAPTPTASKKKTKWQPLVL